MIWMNGHCHYLFVLLLTIPSITTTVLSFGLSSLSCFGFVNQYNNLYNSKNIRFDADNVHQYCFRKDKKNKKNVLVVSSLLYTTPSFMRRRRILYMNGFNDHRESLMHNYNNTHNTHNNNIILDDESSFKTRGSTTITKVTKTTSNTMEDDYNDNYRVYLNVKSNINQKKLLSSLVLKEKDIDRTIGTSTKKNHRHDDNHLLDEEDEDGSHSSSSITGNLSSSSILRILDKFQYDTDQRLCVADQYHPVSFTNLLYQSPNNLRQQQSLHDMIPILSWNEYQEFINTILLHSSNYSSSNNNGMSINNSNNDNGNNLKHTNNMSSWYESYDRLQNLFNHIETHGGYVLLDLNDYNSSNNKNKNNNNNNNKSNNNMNNNINNNINSGNNLSQNEIMVPYKQVPYTIIKNLWISIEMFYNACQLGYPLANQMLRHQTLSRDASQHNHTGYQFIQISVNQHQQQSSLLPTTPDTSIQEQQEEGQQFKLNPPNLRHVMGAMGSDHVTKAFIMLTDIGRSFASLMTVCSLIQQQQQQQRKQQDQFQQGIDDDQKGVRRHVVDQAKRNVNHLLDDDPNPSSSDHKLSGTYHRLARYVALATDDDNDDALAITTSSSNVATSIISTTSEHRVLNINHDENMSGLGSIRYEENDDEIARRQMEDLQHPHNNLSTIKRNTKTFQSTGSSTTTNHSNNTIHERGLRSHTDWTIITPIPISNISGLEIYDPSINGWIRPEEIARQHYMEKIQHQKHHSMNMDDDDDPYWNSNYCLLLFGQYVTIISNNTYQSCIHRVVGSSDYKRHRLSVPLFMRPKESIFQQLDQMMYYNNKMNHNRKNNNITKNQYIPFIHQEMFKNVF